MKENKLLSPAAIFLLGVNSIIGSGIFLLFLEKYMKTLGFGAC